MRLIPVGPSDLNNRWKANVPRAERGTPMEEVRCSACIFPNYSMPKRGFMVSRI